MKKQKVSLRKLSVNSFVVTTNAGRTQTQAMKGGIHTGRAGCETACICEPSLQGNGLDFTR